jgi:isocitrate/isopropylmalate dehydrogenase
MAPSMAVAAKDSYKITLLPGDGIGPEITTATVRITLLTSSPEIRCPISHLIGGIY